MSNYTGLILVTGASKPGIEGKILETLAPFTIEIIDKQSMDIRDRFFLAIYLSLDKAHEKAIMKDLELVVEDLNLDLASDFRQES
ncbi:MAG: ACT domain-containing protein [Candidatus Nanopelagicaceae bacterium]